MDQIFSHSDIISHLKTHYFDETSSTMLSRTCKTLHTCMMPMNYSDAKTIAIAGAELRSTSLLSYAIDLGYKPGIGSSAHAAAMGSVECLEFLMSRNYVVDEYACAQALRYNHVDVFEWLKNNGIEHDGSSYIAAFETNDIDTINWLLEKYPTDTVFTENMEIYDLDVMKLLYGTIYSPLDKRTPYKYAIKHDALNTIEWLFDQSNSNTKVQILLDTIHYAICYKRTNIYGWYCDKLEKLNINGEIILDERKAVDMISIIDCEDDLIEILNSYYEKIAYASIYTLTHHSVKNCLYKLFDFLLKNDTELCPDMFCISLQNGGGFIDHLIKLNCPINEQVFETALQYGNTQFVEYLIENDCPWDEDTVVSALNNLPMLKYFKANGLVFDINYIDSTIEDGSIECLKFIVENIDDPIYNSNHLIHASMLDNTDMIEYIYGFCKDLTSKCYDVAFQYSKEKVVDWLYEHDCPRCPLQEFHFKYDNVELLIKLRNMGFEYGENFMCGLDASGYYKCYEYAHRDFVDSDYKKMGSSETTYIVPIYNELYDDKYVCGHRACACTADGHKICIIKGVRQIQLFEESLRK